MTEMSQPPAAFVEPEADTRLAQLAAQYDQAKADANAAAERLKQITDGLKAELVMAAPGANDIRLSAAGLTKPLQLIAVESWRVDAKKLKAEQVETYVRYARKSTSWRLAAVSD